MISGFWSFEFFCLQYVNENERKKMCGIHILSLSYDAIGNRPIEARSPGNFIYKPLMNYDKYFRFIRK